MNLSQLVEQIKQSKALKYKKAIKPLTQILEPTLRLGRVEGGLEDDAAILPYGDKYLLLASDGISKELFEDPYWAGYCGVLANVNDIYAMGGRPLAMVNVLSARDDAEALSICQGMREACFKFQVPMVGGHFHPESDYPGLSIAILGETQNPLTSFGCSPQDGLLIAIDLDGRYHKNFPHWDSTSQKSSSEVLERLAVLTTLSERKWVHAAKDISNPGILGTMLMLLEASKCGADIELESIPKPEGIDLLHWLSLYPGYGFIFSVDYHLAGRIIDLFKTHRINASLIGRVKETSTLTLHYQEQTANLVI
jgi:hypothetical protein